MTTPGAHRVHLWVAKKATVLAIVLRASDSMSAKLWRFIGANVTDRPVSLLGGVSTACTTIRPWHATIDAGAPSLECQHCEPRLRPENEPEASEGLGGLAFGPQVRDNAPNLAAIGLSYTPHIKVTRPGNRNWADGKLHVRIQSDAVVLSKLRSLNVWSTIGDA